MFDLHCTDCGRFTHLGIRGSDSGTYYGGPCDTEPPDPHIFCPHCAGEQLEEAKRKPERTPIGCWWIKPYYVRVAKAILRHRRKDGAK